MKNIHYKLLRISAVGRCLITTFVFVPLSIYWFFNMLCYSGGYRPFGYVPFRGSETELFNYTVPMMFMYGACIFFPRQPRILRAFASKQFRRVRKLIGRW